MKVYISAPITGFPENVVNRVFSDAENDLAKKGYDSINPLKINESNSSYGECMGKDIQELIDNADAVYFCRGWQKSLGCMLEFHAANIYNKIIMFE